jgi:hypothetical protein
LTLLSWRHAETAGPPFLPDTPAVFSRSIRNWWVPQPLALSQDNQLLTINRKTRP